jgi:GDP-L-fucose synthase
MTEEIIILITGGSGLVGNGIKSIIKKEGLESCHVNLKKPYSVKWIFLSSKDGDLSDFKQTEKIFENYKPTHVIHLAAMVGGLFYNMRANLDFFRKNILINDNVLQMSYKYNVKKVVSCLSSCIFPDKTTYPLTEDMLHDGKPHDSNFGYSYAKRMLAVMNQAYQEILNKEDPKRIFTSIIPCNVYGPHDNFDLEKGHAIPNIIHKAYVCKNKEFKICGTGKARRQFIYSLDLGRLIIWSIFNYEETDPIILSVDEKDEISIYEVTKIILKCMNMKQKIISSDDQEDKDGQFRKTVSNSKLKKYLPNFKFTPIEVGIKETVEWFQNNFDKLYPIAN